MSRAAQQKLIKQHEAHLMRGRRIQVVLRFREGPQTLKETCGDWMEVEDNQDLQKSYKFALSTMLETL